MVREKEPTTYEEAKSGVPADFEEYERELAFDENNEPLPPEFGDDDE